MIDTTIIDGSLVYMPGMSEAVSVVAHLEPRGVKLATPDGLIIGQDRPGGPLTQTAPSDTEKHLYFIVEDNVVFAWIRANVHQPILPKRDGTNQWHIVDVQEHTNEPFLHAL